MKAFQHISCKVTLPDLIRRWGGKIDPQHADTGFITGHNQPVKYKTVSDQRYLMPYKVSSFPLARSSGVGGRVRTLLSSASLILAIASWLQTARILGPREAAFALRWSTRLSVRAMAIWRDERYRSDH